MRKTSKFGIKFDEPKDLSDSCVCPGCKERQHIDDFKTVKMNGGPNNKGFWRVTCPLCGHVWDG